jgi:hypothetical protein
LRKLAAAYLGYKPKKPVSRDFGDLLTMFPGGRIG